MDTLARTKTLEALGFDRPRAEGLVQMVKESIDEEVAKKTDLVALRADLFLVETKLNSKIDSVKDKIIIHLGSLMIGLFGLMFASMVFIDAIRLKLGLK